jgi:haloacid dehalogenase superfamily, subfamily IA, variant 3 with third motif having DD or ED
MAKIRALFWDIGGVLLTNAWDHHERDLAIEHFGLDKVEFESRHKELANRFEQGEFTLEHYLEQTVFYEPRSFGVEDFKRFMFSLSKAKSETLEIARGLAGKYPMATINNESRELNQYRIETFGLMDYFEVFVSSCFVGIRKPDERIYRLAMDLTQRAAEECCFIDDRQENIDGARKVGMQAILLREAPQLRSDLRNLGIEV